MSATIAAISWWWKEHLHSVCKQKLSLQSRAPKEHVEDIKDEDEVKEEEGLVGFKDSLSITTAGNQGTTRGSVKIKHTHYFNTAATLTTLQKNVRCS